MSKLADKAPSEQTMVEFLAALPRLEALMQSGSMDAVIRLADKMPDRQTMEAFVTYMPSKHDLDRLLRAVSDMPKPEELQRMSKLLEEVHGFLKALKG
ncbi:MAG: hypothetical protein Q8R28_08000 [Dehalococcoidia bacterium]|nr:hypothetical protein [Dehalococcoidia bacterium]